MKRFFVCFAMFIAMVLMVACGGSSNKNNNQNDNSDTGDTVTDGDSDSGVSGSADNDPSDSGHENPDTTPEQPDNGDTTTDSGDSEPDGGDTAPDSGDTESNDDSDSGDSQHDDDTDTTPNENPDNLPECSQTSATPCIDSKAVNSDSEKTYLIWSGKSPERLRWVDAVEYCSNLNEGSFNDWQLPTIAALKTLLWSGTYCELGSYCSKFGDIAFFWSATQGAGVDFYTGNSPYKSDAETFDVRCVRKEITTPREKECPELEFENTLYNSVSSITQTWQWSCVCWSPTNEIAYSIAPSTTTCRFTCKPGCNRYNNQCIDPTVECSPTSSTPCTDPSTGLIWSSNVEKSCADLTEGGFNDWREPDLSEIRTLIRNCPSTITGGDCNLTTSCAYRNDACDGCNYDDNGKYNLFGDSGIFVSTTVHDGWAMHYLYVDFDYAALYDYGTYPNKSRLHRCVRSSICDQNYFWNGSECEAAPSQTANCIGLPENAEWNKADKITQTWNGYQWLPTTKGIFDPTESTSDCHFKCASGYSWNGSQCKKIPECEPVNNNSAPCIDTENGIIWSEISLVNRFDNIAYYCSKNIYGGFTDWRSPNIDELKTLLIWSKADSCKVSAVNNCLTSRSDSSRCWSCSTCTEQGTQQSGSWYCNGGYGEAYSDGRFSKFGDSTILGSSSRAYKDNGSTRNWTVNFKYGYVDEQTYQTSSNTSPSIYVRCVRNAE